MASVADTMQQRLAAALSPTALSITDDSAKHAGHAGARAGGESHFTVTITSAAFAGKTRVARHRLVYDALKPLFDEGLHALAIHAHAPGD